jgi:hypothetical protein
MKCTRRMTVALINGSGSVCAIEKSTNLHNMFVADIIDIQNIYSRAGFEICANKWFLFAQ